MAVTGAAADSVKVLFAGDSAAFSEEKQKEIIEFATHLRNIYSNSFSFDHGEDSSYLTIRVFTDYDLYKKYLMKKSSEKWWDSPRGRYLEEIREIVVFKGENEKQALQTIFHEITHDTIHQELPRAYIPAWLNEGLAEFFEWGILEQGCLVVFPNEERAPHIRKLTVSSKIMPLYAYLRLSDFAYVYRGRDENQTMAWSLVYFLMSRPEGQSIVRVLFEALRPSSRESFSSFDIITRSYPGGVAALERDWHAWIAQQDQSPVRFPIES